MSRLHKGLLLGLLTGIAGLLIGISSFGLRFEEAVDLDFLFRLRGEKAPPPEVVIVTLDGDSARFFDCEEDPSKWPRILHARLTRALAKEGAELLVFDVLFEDPQSPGHDEMFAEALRHAGNIVLCDGLEKRIVPLLEKGGAQAAGLSIEKRIEPIPLLKNAAVASAPFPLPKISSRVDQYWTFKAGAEDTATLPVAALQLYAMKAYPEAVRMLKRAGGAMPLDLPEKGDGIVKSRQVEKTIRLLRKIHIEKPHVLQRVLKGLQNDTPFKGENRKLLKALFKMYQSPASRYFNFYGPPGTISTVSCYRVVEGAENPNEPKPRFDFRGKVVFIGYSERLRPDQKDGFYTVYSQPNGVDLSGVEMAATAFSNLLEDMPVEPLSGSIRNGFILFWGLILGGLCRYLKNLTAFLAVVCISILYLFFARMEFLHLGIWFPLFIPLFVQAPAAFFGTLVWKYSDTQKERQQIRKAFGYYLPNDVVDLLTKKVGDIRNWDRPVHGTCLFTDAGRYTRLSESMDPLELSRFMSRYYGVLFEPVKRHGGIIINVVGDSMLAVWATGQPDRSYRFSACLAALEIERKAREFSESLTDIDLPIRIGLHSGKMVLGSIGAMDHFEYRPVGDIVNTASRMEGLNKFLKTRILVSADVLQDLDHFHARELGVFLFAGKSNPVRVFELLCRVEDATEAVRMQCRLFEEALGFYRSRSFEEAAVRFDGCMKIRPEDGPSKYYAELCRNLIDSSPIEAWDGIVRLSEK